MQLIRELGVTGGDDRKIGYYAGLIVSRNMWNLCQGILYM